MNHPESTLARDALIPRNPDGTGRGLVLAILAHGLLVVAIAFGVHWRVSTPAGVDAELWAAVPQIAAPRPAEPDPTPPKPRPPEPKPTEPPPKVEPVQKTPDAQIAIEKAKREEDKRKEDARLAELQRQKDEQERAKKEELERRKKEAEQKRRDEERLAALREDQMRRIMSQAGATGEPTSTGTAQRTAGPSASYAGKIIAKLRPLSVFNAAVAGNPKAEVEIRVLPDGTIQSSRLVKSSGVPAWDEAVLRAIDKAGSLPRDDNGRVQNPTLVVWGPND